MKFRTRYETGEAQKGLVCEMPTRTQQQFKDECEISEILKAHNLGSFIGASGMDGRAPLYADVSSIPDFHESQNHVARATEYFESLPSGVRSQFDNNLQVFLTALNDPANRNALQELGVLVKPTSESETVSEQNASPVVETTGQPVQDASVETTKVASEGGKTA